MKPASLSMNPRLCILAMELVVTASLLGNTSTSTSGGPTNEHIKKKTKQLNVCEIGSIILHSCGFPGHANVACLWTLVWIGRFLNNGITYFQRILKGSRIRVIFHWLLAMHLSKLNIPDCFSNFLNSMNMQSCHNLCHLIFFWMHLNFSILCSWTTMHAILYKY